MDNGRDVKKENKIKKFFSRVFESADKKMKEKAKNTKSCCGSNNTGNKSCCS